MQDNVLPKVDCNYSHDLQKLEKVLTIYSICKDKPIRPFEKKVLIYYLKFGYSPETKKIIVEDTGKRPEYVNTTNTFLREKGFLVENRYEECHLSPDMEMLKKFFVEENKKIYVVSLNGRS